MPGNIDLGEDYDIEEDENNDLVITHTPSGSELRFDSANQLFNFAAQTKFSGAIDANGNNLTGVNTFEASTLGANLDAGTNNITNIGTLAATIANLNQLGQALDANSNDISNIATLGVSTANISQLGQNLNLNNNDLTSLANITANSGATVYDDSTQTVGDGTTSADHESVSTNETLTETIGSGDYHYAGDYDGVDADDRLDSAIAAASEGDTIYLESANYTATRSVSSAYLFVGLSSTGLSVGARINAEWTLTGNGTGIINIRLENCTINLDAAQQYIETFNGTSDSDIVISADRCRVSDGDFAIVTFESGTSQGIADTITRGNVTDNGTNTVGDIT